MRILVVEDDALVAETIAAILTHQNYAVETAPDGEAGWRLAESADFDLVLLDVRLPKLSGLELCQRLRARGYQMPILLLTGCDSPHDKAIGLDAGADDYVVKPFDSEELVARVRALLRRGTVTAQPVLEWGSLHLDPSTCQATFRNTPLPLTPKEYALLELFLRNGRRVFSCDAILEHLWTFDDTPGEEAVRTHIKGLRQKLKTAGAPTDLIETVYGIGYRLKPQGDQAQRGKEPSNKRGRAASDALTTATSSSPAPVKTSAAGPTAGDQKQQTLEAIATVWQRFKPRVAAQIQVLERAAHALARNALSHEECQQAIGEAHTLVGSLGTFGFSEGSNQARQIETILQMARPTAADIQQLTATVTALHQGLDLQIAAAITEAVDPFSKDSSLPEAAAPAATKAAAKILAVDDDPKILAFLHVLLEPWGFQITTLDDAQKFWQVLPETAPDLLILDLHMPHQSGIELCRDIREHDRWCDLPVMILTADTDATTVNRVFAIGADDFVSKPIIGPELVTRIVNRLERVNLLRRLSFTTAKIPTLTNTALVNETERRLTERAVASINPIEIRGATPDTNPAENQQVENDLRVSQARLAGILEIADDAIISVDSHQRITLFNQGAEKAFGYMAQEVMGQPLDILLPIGAATVHRQHIEAFRRTAEKARQMGERQPIFGRRKNGSEFPAEASISQLELNGEKVFTVILRDVTDRKTIDRMKDEFIAIVSHELRTPLTSIYGSLGMLASGMLDATSDRGQRLLQIAITSTDRLVRLINDILDIERIESGKVTMVKTTCDVAELVAAVVDGIQPIANDAGITLAVTAPSLLVQADGDRIIQTLTNLLSNAVKFSPTGSTVRIAVERLDQADRPPDAIATAAAPPEVRFMVSDQGRGIPPEKLSAIFERFQQVDVSDSRNHDGTGLGLAICRSIVHQHGGRIWVESTPDAGSTFYFTLPLTR